MRDVLPNSMRSFAVVTWAAASASSASSASNHLLQAFDPSSPSHSSTRNATANGNLCVASSSACAGVRPRSCGGADPTTAAAVMPKLQGVASIAFQRGQTQ